MYFLKNDIVVLVFVDDCLLFSRNKNQIDSLIASLEKDFVLTDEGEITKYLGIDVT